MRISELMCDAVKCCYPTQTLADATQIMWEYDCGCVPVVDSDERVVGIITDRDICMTAYLKGKALADVNVGDTMAKDVLVCTPDSDVWEVESMMQRSQVRRLPVVDGAGRLVGIISLNDLAQEAERERQLRTPLVSLSDVALTLGAVCRPRRSFEHATI